VPVFVIGELRGGIERLRRRGDQPQAASLEVWLQTVHEDFAARILAFDLTCAETWGQLMSIDTQNPIDKQLAAMALVYDLSVVTHNVSHFEGTGVRVLNPFAADAGPLIL
jgi:predicted nucleic acid-binding protein